MTALVTALGELDLDEVSIPDRVVGREAEAADQLDLATALAISQAISSEMDQGRLVEGLLSMAVRTAGAEHAVLLLPREGNMVVEAYAIARDGRVDIRLAREGDRSAMVCEGLVRQVITTGTPVALDDAASIGPFVDEPYVVAQRCRSLACIPLTRRGQLEGVLYFENNLAARVFRGASIRRDHLHRLSGGERPRKRAPLRRLEEGARSGAGVA